MFIGIYWIFVPISVCQCKLGPNIDGLVQKDVTQVR